MFRRGRSGPSRGWRWGRDAVCFRRRLGCAGPARGNKGGPVVAAAPRNQARAFPAASPAVSFLPNLLSFGLASVGAGVRRPRARWLPKSPQPEGCRRGSPRPLCPCPRFASGRAVGRCHRSGISGKQVADRECVTGVYLLWVWFFFFFPSCSHGVQRQSGCSSAKARTR